MTHFVSVGENRSSNSIDGDNAPFYFHRNNIIKLDLWSKNNTDTSLVCLPETTVDDTPSLQYGVIKFNLTRASFMGFSDKANTILIVLNMECIFS